MDERVNVAIIGAGPAGAAAAMYLKRAGLEPLLLEQAEPGGLLHEANLVENYPGFPDGIPGGELASLIARQLQRLEVRMIEASAKKVGTSDLAFETITDEGSFISNAVIIATGTEPKKTDILGADAVAGDLLMYGVSKLSAEQIEGKRVAVLGGGDAAFDYALNLSDKGGSVTILSRSEPTCLALLAERARERNIEIIAGRDIVGIAETPAGVVITCDDREGQNEIVCDVVVVAHGRQPRLEILDRSLRDRIDAAHPPETGVPGLYLAGDVVRGINRQAAIAAGDGVLAAMMIERFFKNANGRGSN